MKKNFQFEILRAVSCLLVIAIHVSNIYNRSYPDLPAASYWTALAVNAVARVSVPLFFMLSGALLAGREPELGKSLRRAGRYLGLTAAWVLFYLVWTTAYLHNPYDFRKVLAVPPSTHLWFLYAILAIYLALPLIQALVGRLDASPALTGWLFVLLAASVWGEYLVSFTPLETKYGIPLVSGGRYLLFFLAGHVLYVNRARIRLGSGALAALLAGASLGSMLLTGCATLAEGVHNEHFFEYRSPLIFLAAAATFVLICRIPAERIGPRLRAAITHVAANSLGIYLLHAVFLNIAHQELDMPALPAVCGIPLYVLAIFLVTDGLVTGLRRVPGVRRLF